MYIEYEYELARLMSHTTSTMHMQRVRREGRLPAACLRSSAALPGQSEAHTYG
jgi:hypothetical protein